MAVLYIVSTPIGNLNDMTLRALQVLFSVPVIAAEDTRRTGNLLDYFRKRGALLEAAFAMEEEKVADAEKDEEGFPMLRKWRQEKPRYISFHEYNENDRIAEIVTLLQSGQDVALVSDGGTPLVSDPGFKLVRQVLKEKIRVVSVPGPCAWLAALTTSGMPPDRVMFVGFLPPRDRRRKKELAQLQQAVAGLRKQPTIVLYEAPHRMVATLRTIQEVAGNVEMVLARELTKLHESVKQKSVGLWIAELEKQKNIKGELVVLFRFDGNGVSTNDSELAQTENDDEDDTDNS